MIKLFYTGAGAFNTPQTLASKSLGSYISNTAVPNGVANSLFNPLSVMEFYSKKKITQYIGLGLYLFFFDNEESYDKVDLIFSLLYNEENEIEMNFFKNCFEYKIGLGPISGDSTYGYYIEKITEEAKPFYMLRDFQTLTFNNEVIFENIDLNEKGVGVWISRTFNPKNFKEIFGFNSDYWINNDKLPNGDFIVDLNINFRPTVYSVNLFSSDLDYGIVNGSGSYVSGTEVEISAIPNQNCRFEKWSDGNTNAVRTIVVDKNIELTAEFASITFKYMYIEAVEDNSTISLNSTLQIAPNIEYSFDGITFYEWQHTTIIEDDYTIHTFDTIELSAGDIVYFRGINETLALVESGMVLQYTSFTMTGLVRLGGSLQSLKDGKGFDDIALQAPHLFMVVDNDFEHRALFEIEDGFLSATELTPSCYAVMFQYQTNLEKMCNLPATIAVSGAYTYMMYMTWLRMSDDGINFNFNVEIANNLPQQIDTYFLMENPYDVANWMGNTSGFIL